MMLWSDHPLVRCSKALLIRRICLVLQHSTICKPLSWWRDSHKTPSPSRLACTKTQSGVCCQGRCTCHSVTDSYTHIL